MSKINGINRQEAVGKTLEEYLQVAGYDKNRVAVERNGEIVPKTQYSAVVLKETDVIEVVSFVGGG